MAKEFRFPDLGEGVAEGELVKWLVKEGDSVKVDQEVAEVETDKALVPIPSPYAGKVEKLNYREGDSVKVGSVLMTFGESDASQKSIDTHKASTSDKPKVSESQKTVSKQTTTISSEKDKLPPLAAPYTRQIARELGVKLEEVQGSGPGGRISEEDVRRFAEQSKSKIVGSKTKNEENESPKESGIKEDFTAWGKIEKVPIKGIRRKISEHMLQTAQQTVMVTHIDEAIVDKLSELRQEKLKFAEERKVKLTLLPFLMKACVIALKNYPYLNASLIEDEIILKHYYHFGFAVDTEAGLIVPVLRDVDKKSIMHLASELSELSAQARSRKIEREALLGHSFSITNIGSIGGKAFTPVIHYPNSAILGLGRTYEKPVVRDGKVAISKVLPLCLTFDHRVTDGATAARFVNEVIRYLEDPDLLLLDGEA